MEPRNRLSLYQLNILHKFDRGGNLSAEVGREVMKDGWLSNPGSLRFETGIVAKDPLCSVDKEGINVKE